MMSLRTVDKENICFALVFDMNKIHDVPGSTRRQGVSQDVKVYQYVYIGSKVHNEIYNYENST